MRRTISRLGRSSSKRKPKRKFILYCEGINTEPGYFGILRVSLGNILIDIEAIGGVGVPSTIAQFAIDRVRSIRRSNAKKNSFERNDQVWAVFDRDEHPCFSRAMIDCENNGVSLAVSDPCFEVWLILHYEPYERPDGRHAVQRKLAELCKDYDLSRGKNFTCDNVLARAREAAVRAKKQFNNRVSEGDIGPPYTTVYKLVEAMVGTPNKKKAKKA